MQYRRKQLLEHFFALSAMFGVFVSVFLNFRVVLDIRWVWGHSLANLCIFASLRAFSGIWGYFLAVLASLCLFARRNKNERRANIEQRRATSSNVEQRRATSSKRRANVEQRRATSSKRRATSSNVEQRRANVEQRRAMSSNVEKCQRSQKETKMPESAHRCTNVHNFESKCLQTQ